MPTPRTGESRDEFVDRCIPIVIDDGTAQDGAQAVAVCNSIYTDKAVHLDIEDELEDEDENEDEDEDEEKQLPGLYLADPHGPLIWDGAKSAIVKSSDTGLEGTWVLTGPGFPGAADPGKAYGIIQLGAPETVNLKLFDEQFDEHRVTKAERRKWWPEAEKLFVHPIMRFEKWDPPKEVHIPQGVRDTIKEVEFTGKSAYVYRRPVSDTVVAKNAVRLGGAGDDIHILLEPEADGFVDEIIDALPAHADGTLTIDTEPTNGKKTLPVADLVLRWKRGPLQAEEKAGLPKNEFNLTTGQTLRLVEERGAKYSQPDSNYRIPTENPREACGACRFFLRDPNGGPIGRCEVVDGPIAWFATSDYYIAAEDEAIATFAAMGAYTEMSEHLDEDEEEGSEHEEEGYSIYTDDNNKQERPSKRTNGTRLFAGDFASVGDASEPGTWKLPLTKTPGGVDAGRIAAAITAMQPGGFRGQRVELTAPKAQVVGRIRRAIGKLDDDDAKERLTARLGRVKELTDVEVWTEAFSKVQENRPSKKSGRRMSRRRAGTLRRVRDELFKLVEKVSDIVGWADYDDKRPWVPFRSVKLYVDQNGQKGMVVWTTNAFIDRDNEMFETKALEEYVKRHEDDTDKGSFWFWHIPGSKFATIKAQGVVGRFLVEAGPFDDTPAGKAFEKFFEEYPEGHPAIAPEGWGASHGFVFDPKDRKDGVYKWFEKHESSVLPGSVAANPHNPSLEVFEMNEKQEEAFRSVVGDELVDSLLATGDKLTETLESQGVAHKERASEADAETDGAEEKPKAEQEEVTPTTEDSDGEEEEGKEPEVTAEGVKAEFATVEQLEDVGESIKIMATHIGTLTDTMQAFVATEDERIDEKLENTPNASLKALISERVVGSKKTRLRKDSKLAKAGPEETDPGTDGKGTGIPVLDRLKALNERDRGGG